MSATNYNDPLARGPGGVLETTTTMVGGGSHTHRRISWAAIFGGVVLVVAVQLLLSMLGAGIGLGTVNVNAGSTPDASSFGIGAGVWWVVSSIIALGFGGYVAAWLAGIELRWDGLLHGLVTWGIATLLTIYLLSAPPIGGIIGGGLHTHWEPLHPRPAAASRTRPSRWPRQRVLRPTWCSSRHREYLKPADPGPRHDDARRMRRSRS